MSSRSSNATRAASPARGARSAAPARASSPARTAPARAASPAARAASPGRAAKGTTTATKPPPYRRALAEIEASIKGRAGPPTAKGTTVEQREWLENNALADPEIVALPSGLQYKVVRSAPPNAPSPKLDTPCEVHYWGSTTNGVEFDSSYERGTPTTVVPSKMIPGWTIAMQLMAAGDTWLLAVPSELAYGDAGRADERRGQYIQPGSVIIFELELLAVKGASKPKPKRPPAPPAGTFIPSKSFRGAREGFVFSTRAWGTGYYLDGEGGAPGSAPSSAPSSAPTSQRDDEPPQQPQQQKAPKDASVVSEAAGSEAAEESALSTPGSDSAELFEREPLQPSSRLDAHANAQQQQQQRRRPPLPSKPSGVPKLAAVPELANPLRVLRENLGQAETPLEAVQVLLSRLHPDTVRAVTEDLGLETTESDDKAELTHRLYQALA